MQFNLINKEVKANWVEAQLIIILLLNMLITHMEIESPVKNVLTLL